ncbi:hypothetical protein CF149_03599 [Pseudomonas psychrophila]|jgi:hypothetical protein|nr:hypothetical protein CF149_03599 [Pseudomonas psychrophila]
MHADLVTINRFDLQLAAIYIEGKPLDGFIALPMYNAAAHQHLWLDEPCGMRVD